MNHKGQAVVLWGGSDIVKAKKFGWKFPPRIKHITFTKQNQLELKRIGIFSKVKPMVFLDHSLFNLYPLGSSIFCYVPWKRAKFYGIETIKQIAIRLPKINFILARYGPKKKPFRNCTVYPLLNEKALINLYKSSFCSIRPTRHDGFPQSIAELGLMGRKTGWIYDSDLATQCRSIQDYVNFIKEEKNRSAPRKGLRKKFLSIAEQMPNILDEYF